MFQKNWQNVAGEEKIWEEHNTYLFIGKNRRNPRFTFIFHEKKTVIRATASDRLFVINILCILLPAGMAPIPWAAKNSP